MNQSLRPTPLTPDAVPPVDSTFTLPRQRPIGSTSGTIGYRTSAWDGQDRHWKGWPFVAIGAIVAAMVFGANYVTKDKVVSTDTVAVATSPNLPEPGPSATDGATAPEATPATRPAETPPAPASKSPTPEETLSRAPTAAGPATATPKKPKVTAPNDSVAAAPQLKEPAPAEPLVSVPTPPPVPAASMPAARTPAPEPQPTPAPAQQPEQQPAQQPAQ